MLIKIWDDMLVNLDNVFAAKYTIDDVGFDQYQLTLYFYSNNENMNASVSSSINPDKERLQKLGNNTIVQIAEGIRLGKEFLELDLGKWIDEQTDTENE